MNCFDCQTHLNDFVDCSLSASTAAEVAAHLADCPHCREQQLALAQLRAATAALPTSLQPARDLWPDIAAKLGLESKAEAPSSFALNQGATPSYAAPPIFPASTGAAAPTQHSSSHNSGEESGPRAANSRRGLGRLLRFPRSPLAFMAAASILVVLSVGALWRNVSRSFDADPRAFWSVAALAGTPRIGSASVSSASTLRPGQWLETDTSSRARVNVGSIGEVNIEPGSRVRMLEAAATHRLELARGHLSARIWAPPRLFFVETPSATAIDLGCAYTLDVDDVGDGTLHVTSGYVALQRGNRESLVRAGQKCHMRRGSGPGTPFAADAPAEFERALRRFDRDGSAEALRDVLALSREADAVTLVHLLRTSDAYRDEVFATLARHRAPPVNVTREGILRGDATMIEAWAAELGVANFPR